ncbi:4-fold beta flower protein [Terrisporobacter muris]|uniref:4-fold beta flower domain-containing protein n=1 Tax=Terrisporobacter muris TaxID=2963284 RepID=A0A9X2M6F5_9FIRM|nr:hypothetical protein [Terrisporobacter muris]MCR1821722.1 hypothetical protein [Terrisporobacter muris]
MKYVWTWKGKFFGYINNGYLFTKSGKCVGVLSGKDIYGRNGKYIGEVMNNDRLITCKSKRNYSGPSAPYINGGACGTYGNYCAYGMYGGYEDFPEPNSF